MNKLYGFIVVLLIIPLVAGIVSASGCLGQQTTNGNQELSMLCGSISTYFPSMGLYDYYRGDSSIRLFYPVEQWEIETCTRDITMDTTKGIADAAQGVNGDSTDRTNIYGMTAQLSVSKYVYSRNDTLYEVAWYIQPATTTVHYNIYLTRGTRKVLWANGTADPAQGASGYLPAYRTENFTDAIMEYDGGSLPTIIVTNPHGLDYGTW